MKKIMVQKERHHLNKINHKEAKNNNSRYKIHCGKFILDLAQRTHIMGVLNVTPDSFYDGSRYVSVRNAVRRAIEMVSEGADIIDIGGESTRPGALPVSVEEEKKRILPIIRELIKEINCPISVDTYKADVAQAALDAGAHMINDITALRGNNKMGEIVKHYGVPIVLMHMQGNPSTMQKNPSYKSVVPEILLFLKKQVQKALELGIDRKNIIVDPGIGFGKRLRDNLAIISRLKEFSVLHQPILIGPSRKSFIGDILNLPAKERLFGTAATVACTIINGAHIIRVHDVKQMREVAMVVDAIHNG